MANNLDSLNKGEYSIAICLRLRIKQSKRLRWHREWTKIKTVRHDHICPTLQPIFQKIADNQSEIHEKHQDHDGHFLGHCNQRCVILKKAWRDWSLSATSRGPTLKSALSFPNKYWASNEYWISLQWVTNITIFYEETKKAGSTGCLVAK